MSERKPMIFRAEQHRIGQWSLGAIILALIGTVFWAYVFFVTPNISVLGHTIVVTQGLLAGALLIAAYFWAIIEVLTPAGTTYWHLGIRAAIAIIAGSFVGGAIAYYTNFGAYLIIPALNHNWLALAMLISVFYMGAVLLWGAAHAHTKTFARRG